MNHAPGAGSIAQPVDRQSSVLPLYHECSLCESNKCRLTSKLSPEASHTKLHDSLSKLLQIKNKHKQRVNLLAIQSSFRHRLFSIFCQSHRERHFVSKHYFAWFCYFLECLGMTWFTHLFQVIYNYFSKLELVAIAGSLSVSMLSVLD